MSEPTLSEWIAERAASLGFDLCGVAEARAFPELACGEEWLARGYAGEMSYLADPRRANPAAVLPGVRSVIVCALNYNTALPRSTAAVAQSQDSDEPRGWISRYAWGTDYHLVLKQKLEALLGELRQRRTETFAARVYTDTGPLHERVLAKYAGLGWIGKNTLLLNQRLGSYFFLGTILTTLDLAPTLGTASAPPADLCGTCRRCLEACPTDALIEPYVMDARRCISYLTIELRGSVPQEFRPSLGNHVFGCDICQDVCPWNNRAPVNGSEEFQPRRFPADDSATSDAGGGERTAATRNAMQQSLYLPELRWLAGLSEEEFRTLFRDSPIKRTKWRGLVRNACMALGNAQPAPGTPNYEESIALLRRLAESSETVLAESAQWALSRIQPAELKPVSSNCSPG